MSDTIKPTLSVPIFGGEVAVHAFGAEHGCNFSFRGIDASKDPLSTHADIFSALASIPARCDYFAPSPMKMNAGVVSALSLFNGKVAVHRRRSAPYGDFKLYRGAFADGLTGLNMWNGYAMSSADCALVVVKCGDLIIASHAGRGSVIDMNRMKGGPPRKFESVVESICAWIIAEKGCPKQNVLVWIGISLSPGPHFAHEKSSVTHPHNRTMVDYVTRKYGKACFADDGQGGNLGWLDLKELIRRQFIHHGIPEENVFLDDVCTCTDTKEEDYVWYSNVRDKENRNLIAVVKNA